MFSNSRKQDVGIAVAASLLMLLLAFHWYRPGLLIGQGDTFFGYDQINNLRKGLLAWNHIDGFFGQNDPSAVWAPWLLVAGVLTNLWSAPVSQILMFWLLLAGAWNGMFGLLRALECSALASFLVAWTYVLNPWTQVIFAGAGSPPFMGTVALLPWYGQWILAAAGDPAKRRATMLAITLATFLALPLIAVNPVLIIIFGLGALTFFGLGLHMTQDRAGFFRWSLRALGASVLASLWWSFPILNVYREPVTGTTLSPDSWSWVVGRASLLNNMRLNPFWSWAHPEFYPFAKNYDADPLTYASGFLLIIGLAIALATLRGQRARLVSFAAAVALAALFLSKGLHPPFVWLSDAIYRLPGTGLFREPTTKFPLIALPMLAIALAWAIDQAVSGAASARGALLRRLSISAVVLVAIASSASAMLSGKIFHDETTNYHDNSPGLPSVYFKLPDYWRHAERFIDTSPATGGVLVLPADPYYQVDYDWGYYGADSLPNWLIHRRVLMLNLLGYIAYPKSSAVQQRIATALERGSPQLAGMLPDLGIRYVLFRGDVHVPNAGASLPTTRKRIEAAFAGKRKTTFGPLEVFDLGTDAFAGARESADWIAGNFGDINPADITELRAFGERVPRFDVSDEPPLADRKPMRFERRVDTALGDEDVNVDSEGLARGVPSRLIASGAKPGGFGVVRLIGRTFDVRASFLRDETRSEEIRVALSRLEPTQALTGQPLLSTIQAATNAKGEMVLAVFNPERDFVTTDIEVGVHPEVSKTFLLRGQSDFYVDELQAADGIVWARFRNVLLTPAENDFLLSSSASSELAGRRETPRVGLRIGLVHFSHIRKYGIEARNRASNPQAALAAAELTTTRTPLGGFTLNTPVEELPTLALTFQETPSENIGGVITARSGTERYLCYTRLLPEIPASLAGALLRCFANSDIQVDLHRLVVTRVDLDASIPAHSSLNFESLERGQLIASRQLQPSWDILYDKAVASATGVVTKVTHQDAMTQIILSPLKSSLAASNIAGRNVIVNSRVGQISGRVVTMQGTTVEIEDDAGTMRWVPLSTVDALEDRGAALATVRVRWPASIAVEPDDRLAVDIIAGNGVAPAETSPASGLNPPQLIIPGAAGKQDVVDLGRANLLGGAAFAIEQAPSGQAQIVRKDLPIPSAALSVRLGDQRSGSARAMALSVTPDQTSAFSTLSLAALAGRKNAVVREIVATFTVPISRTQDTIADVNLNVLHRRPTYSVFLRAGSRSINVVPARANFFSASFPTSSGELPVAMQPRDTRLSVLTIGAAPCGCRTERPTHAIVNVDGLLIAQLPIDAPGIIVTDELYNAEWLGIRLAGEPAMMRHMQADGWRNAWVTDGGGTVVLINVAVVAQIVFGLIGLGLIGFLILRRK